MLLPAYHGNVNKPVASTLAALITIATLSACAETPPDFDLAGRTFTGHVISVDGVNTPAANGSTIAVTFTDDAISVNAGCNTLFAQAQWNDSAITVADDAVASTMMACDAQLMQQDQMLSEFLTSDPQWEVEGTELTLTSGSTSLILVEQ